MSEGIRLWKVETHGEPRIGGTTIEGPEHIIRFFFKNFIPKRAGHYAELFDPDGKSIARSTEKIG